MPPCRRRGPPLTWHASLAAGQACQAGRWPGTPAWPPAKHARLAA